VEGGWGASTTGRERAGCDPTKTKWPPLFFSGGSGRPRLPFFFQVISARRGGAAADAVVGAGGQKPARVRGAAAPRHRAQAQAE
jgi:hypothetical protein